MKRRCHVLLLASLALSACASARLSHDEARRKIAEIGQSTLVPDAIDVRRIVSQTDTRAIAESTVTLAFQFARATPQADWQIEAVRIGDRDWISLNELIAAVNESRRRTTSESMQRLADGVERYRAANNGAIPTAPDIVALTDKLHPSYMTDLIREDGWGKPILFEVTGPASFRFVSVGADGRRGTSDDLVLEKDRAFGP